MIEIISKKSSDTFKLGKEFSKKLKKGDIVAFYGGLGVGKTVFIKGVCKGLGINNDVVSPTFTIINEYTSNIKVFHIDFYRVDEISELSELGVEEYLYNNGICLIEWAEKIEVLLPEIKVDVKMDFVSGKNNWRRIRINKK